MRFTTPSPFFNRLKHALLSAPLLALAACGGGGGSTPANPVVNISASAGAAAVGQSVTLTWSASNTTGTCTASGAWSGSLASSGSQSVTVQTAGSATYTLTCGGVSNSVTVTVSGVPVNTTAVVLDAGPAGNAINVPYVTITVCQPGTSTCKTIDHVMVDTGSYGLRLLASSMSGLTLPAVNAPSGAAAGECAAFVSGYIWGPVQQADVKIAGETASSVPIQVIGATNAPFSPPPASCSSTGASLSSTAKLGANGILGIGMFQQDCGNACATTAVSATYYSCPTTGCVASRMPLTSQVANPVAMFARDNNGVLLTLPSVAAGGATALSGTLTFGIGTQSNNAVGAAKVYAADANGNFVTLYNGQKLASSFLDSGSNGLFFNDSGIPLCSDNSGFYCPATTLSLSAVNSSYDGATSGTVNFTITNISKLGGSIVAAPVGGSNGSFSHNNSTSYFNWGLPFFFGRNVFVAFSGASTPNGTGPYWAY